MTYLDIRDSAVEQIKTAFGDDERLHVAAHPGRFDEGEIRRLMMHTPAILTSLMSIKDSEVQDECSMDFVSWVLYRASNQDRLYSGALTLVSGLIGAIKALDSPVSFGGGTGIKAECLYSGSLDKINAALWAIKWRWQTRGIDSGNESILLPNDLEWFEGYDSGLIVGTQKASDEVHL